MLVCGAKEGHGPTKVSMTDGQDVPSTVSFIFLNVNPWCIRIKTAIGNGKRIFHAR